jgi:hypothetical protein
MVSPNLIDVKNMVNSKKKKITKAGDIKKKIGIESGEHKKMKTHSAQEVRKAMYGSKD